MGILDVLASPLPQKSNRGDFNFSNSLINANKIVQQGKATAAAAEQTGIVNERAERQLQINEENARIKGEADRAKIKEAGLESAMKLYGRDLREAESFLDQGNIQGAINVIANRQIRNIGAQKDNPDLDVSDTQSLLNLSSDPPAFEQTVRAELAGVRGAGLADKPKFQTDVGKSVADRELAVNLFGDGSPQVQAFDEAFSAKATDDVKLTDVAGLRKEFTKQSGDFIKIRDAFNKINSASDTGAGDVSLIFSFMKIIDPGSTVREGEFATAEATAGIPTRIRTLYNKALSGERLGAVQRDNFKSEAANLFHAQLKTQTTLEGTFSELAVRSGMNPQDIAIDFMGETRNFDFGGTGEETGELTPAERAELNRRLEIKRLQELETQ